MEIRMACPQLLLLLTLGCGVAAANPAPAPLLQSPVPGATSVDPDPTLSWRWMDDLMDNGSFENGLTPWYTTETSPNIWQILTAPTNYYGMGYNLATTYMPLASRATAQLIQDLSIPADATSATLQWSERVFNYYYTPPQSTIGRFRIWLLQGGTPVALLENATGLEPAFQSHNWVTRSTNLLAFAGQSFQLVIQADSYSTAAMLNWFADVDGFSFSCEHASAPPEFQVYVGKSSVLRSTNLVGDTTALSFASIPLAASTTYYWRVGAVRDGVTNYSATTWFRTAQRVLPPLTIIGQTATGMRLSFPTHTSRYYTIQQADTLGGNASWYDVLSAGLGTGIPMEVEVPWSWTDTAFWRLRVDP